MRLGIYLASRELWRNKGKFLLFSLVISLITLLILFVAALSEGLGSGNREYIENLNGELLVYQKNVDLSIGTSQLARAELNSVKRVDGVEDAGPIGFSRVSIPRGGERKPLDVSMIGVEPGMPGEPPVLRGQGLTRRNAREAVIDKNVASLMGLKVGDTFQIRAIQGTTEEFFPLEVMGITDSRKYSLQPSIFVPLLTWERIKPQQLVGADEAELLSNVIVAKLKDARDVKKVSSAIQNEVGDVDVADLKMAYEATPGYSAQQSTLNTQRDFALLIGILVIGGFFQIQTLQKVAQIGMLKAIGAPNRAVVSVVMTQIVILTSVGVAIGTVAALALSLSFPPTIPIVFKPGSVVTSVLYLLIIGPLGGLISIRYVLRVEPLTALGLTS